MGVRFRKSVNLGGGFRVNVSKSGIGYSWGTKGYRYTKTAKGSSRRTYSIPGTGLSYVSESGKSKRPSSESHARGASHSQQAEVSNAVSTESVNAGDYQPAEYEELLAQMQRYAVEGPQLFPDGMTTDQPDQQVCAEIIREKMLLCLDKEIPHGTAVEVTRFTEREDSGIIDLDVTIYCEKASHKGIIIGKHGDMLKRISTLARQDIEKFMGTKVYLETWVKVKENWRDNVNFIRSQGYNEQ